MHVTCYTETRNCQSASMIPYNDIPNDMIDKDRVMLCIIDNVIVVPEFHSFHDGTV